VEISIHCSLVKDMSVCTYQDTTSMVNVDCPLDRTIFMVWKSWTTLKAKKLKCVAPCAYHTVFVTVDDCVYTSGYCAFGSLGQGHQSQPCPLPVKVNHPDLANGLKRIKTAVCGQWHTIVITEDGSAYSWGYNNHGQCGLNSSSLGDVASPSLVTGIPPHEKLVDARCGSCFTVFRTESNTFYGCGSNDHGALGLPTVYQQSVVAHIPLSIGTVLDYSCGTNFTVFTTKEGGAYTCGYRNSGLGDIFQLRDRQVCLPRVVSRTESHRELSVACGQSGLHIILCQKRFIQLDCLILSMSLIPNCDNNPH